MTYWGHKWGGTWGLGSADEEVCQGGYDQDALKDTLFLSKSDDGTLSELATDRSQQLTNLTVGTDCVHETGSRLNSQAPWTMEWVIDAHDTDYGVLFHHGSGASEIMITLSADGLYLNIDNPTGDTDISLTNIGLTTGTPRDKVVLGISAELNLDTSGDSDLVRYWLYAQNITQGTFAQATDTGYDTAVISDTATILAETTSGANAIPGDCYALRFSEAFHTATEIRHAFYGAIAAPTLTAESRAEVMAPDKACGIGDDGEFLSVPAAIGASTRKHDLRLLGPVLQLARDDVIDTTFRRTWTDGVTPPFTDGQYAALAPGSDDEWAFSQYLVKVPLHPLTTHLRVRVRLHEEST